MPQKAKMNLIGATLLFGGLLLIAAGALVPSEETVALGFFFVLGAAAVLMGLNWPKTRAPQLASNLVSLDAYRASRRSPR